MTFEVQQNEEEEVFFCTIHRKKAYLSYTQSTTFLTLHSLHMPDLTVEEKEETEAIRKTLVKRALEYASENELVVIPQATYVTTQFLPEHPQYLHLLKKRARDRLLRKLHENR